jgi:predicted transcriptional regulator
MNVQDTILQACEKPEEFIKTARIISYIVQLIKKGCEDSENIYGNSLYKHLALMESEFATLADIISRYKRGIFTIDNVNDEINIRPSRILLFIMVASALTNTDIQVVHIRELAAKLYTYAN